MEMLYIVFVFSLILSSSYAAVQDFCVADYKAPFGPAGYSCKRPENVKVDDFVYSGLGNAGNTSNIYRAGLTKASYEEVPGLNGLGISMARIDLAPGGVVPLHTHPGSNEIFLLVKGKLIAGFISSDMNTVYQTTIKSGDIFVIPEGLLHFFANIGGAEDKATSVISLLSERRLLIHRRCLFPTQTNNRPKHNRSSRRESNIMKKKCPTAPPYFILSLLFISTSLFSLTHAAGGKWQLLLKNVGISAMHMQLLKNDRVVMFDRTDFGKSNLSLPNGVCRNNPKDTALKVDCTAHSAEYDVASNKIRPLFVYSDVWCSSGSVNPSGTLVQTGGFVEAVNSVSTLFKIDQSYNDTSSFLVWALGE